MSKHAKTVTTQELRRVLDHVATRKHAARNRLLVMTSHLAGLRASELANLRVGDVVDQDGRVRNEIRLRAEETKGGEARTVFVSERLQKEIAGYVKTSPAQSPTSKLFYTQKRHADGFTANTMTQFFWHLYRAAGIEASSHSGRRYFITKMSAAGVSARAIMALAGHKNLATTQRYIDVHDDMLRKAVELV